MAQLVEKYSQTPQVQQVVMRLLLHHFRCHIFQSSAESIALLALIIWLLHTPTEVTNFKHVLLSNE